MAKGKLSPMLAATAEAEPGKAPVGLQYPLLVSPKLDGIRALRYNGQLVSRTLHTIPSPKAQRITAHLPDGIDGELIVGEPFDDPFRRTDSVVTRRTETNPDADLRYYIFDNYKHGGGFYERHKALSDVEFPIVVVPHIVARNDDDLLAQEEEALAMGYEGIMLRSMDGPYKYGRSTVNQGWLMKLKRFKDSEAIVLDCFEQMHNANEATTNALGKTERSTAKAGQVPTGMIGGFHVRDVNKESPFYGIEFDVSSSTIPVIDRPEMWRRRKSYEGRILTYKYFPTGSKEKPRFPTFKGWRSPIDI